MGSRIVFPKPLKAQLLYGERVSALQPRDAHVVGIRGARMLLAPLCLVPSLPNVSLAVRDVQRSYPRFFMREWNILCFCTVLFDLMLAHISLMRLHGKALDQHRIRTASAVRGDIVVAHENVTALGRYSDVATIGGGRVNETLLFALYDCRLAHMGTSGFVLSGLEFIGSIAYAQAWWCRPE